MPCEVSCEVPCEVPCEAAGRREDSPPKGWRTVRRRVETVEEVEEREGIEVSEDWREVVGGGGEGVEREVNSVSSSRWKWRRVSRSRRATKSALAQ